MSLGPRVGIAGSALVTLVVLGCAPAVVPVASAPPAERRQAPEPSGRPAPVVADTASGSGESGRRASPGRLSSPPSLPPSPPEGSVASFAGLTPSARRVLDSLPDPSEVILPPDLLRAAAAAPGRPTGARPALSAGCYEVQLVAASEAGAARRISRRAADRFRVSTRVVTGGGLHRVRAGGCLDAAAARALRTRARRGGFPDAFLTQAD